MVEMIWFNFLALPQFAIILSEDNFVKVVKDFHRP